MFPEILKLPGSNVALPSYGVCIALGFVLAVLVAGRLAEHDGIAKKTVYDLAFYTLPVAFFGAKLLMIFSVRPSANQNPSYESTSSVGAYFGGLLVCLCASWILTRVWGVSWCGLADACAPALALGNAIGRIGCFLGGCCWGKPTTSWLGVRFSEKAHLITGVPDGVTLLPTQLFQAGASALSFAFLLWLWKRRLFGGQVVLAYLLAYSAERFIIDFWRNDPRGELMGFSTSQWISVVVFPVALTLLTFRWRHGLSIRADDKLQAVR